MDQFLSSNHFQFNASNGGNRIKRRLTMDYDGNLRLNSFNNSKKLWYASWQAMVQKCEAHRIINVHVHLVMK